MAIITDRHIHIYQDTITDVRNSLGRIATIYLAPTNVDCAWCILDPVSNRSSGVPEPDVRWEDHPNYSTTYNIKICPECNGKGYVQTDNTETVNGTKKDLSYNDNNESSVGFFRPGTIRFSCDLDKVLVTPGDRNGQTYFDIAIKVVLDGETYKVLNTSKSGLRDLYTCRVIMERTNLQG